MKEGLLIAICLGVLLVGFANIMRTSVDTHKAAEEQERAAQKLNTKEQQLRIELLQLLVNRLKP